MVEIKLRFFYRKNFNLRGCAGVAATGGTRRAHHFMHVKSCYCLVIPITSRGRPVLCCLLSRPPVSRLGNLHNLPSETKELQNFSFAESQCADTGTNDTGILQRMSEAWSLCALPQATKHKGLFHMKPRASPAATELTVSKDAFCLPRGVISAPKCLEKASF